MIFEIGTEDKKISVEVGFTVGTRKIRMGDAEIVCDWKKLADGQYSMIVDGRVYDFLIDLDEDVCEVLSRIAEYNFHIVDPRRSRYKQSVEEGRQGLQRICADMPGKVLRVMAKKGDFVALDEGLLILEAMKMQNEIRSPKSGTVAEVRATAGTTVSTGDFLLSIE